MMVAACGVDSTGNKSLVCAASLKIHHTETQASTKVNTIVIYDKYY